jgi:hypothetical protein
MASSIAPLLLLLVPALGVGLFAQDAPKLEVFGGYSYLGAGSNTSATSFGFDTANLNGWNAAAKFNVTSRIGIIADFSGDYGDRAVTVPAGSNPALQPRPSEMRQHTFLFGPQFRLFTNKRVAVNVRALAGVAHANTLVAPLAQPIESAPPPSGEWFIGVPGAPITELTAAGGNGFAASFGGSIDYRFNDRLSYRVVQPEFLLTRLGGSSQPNLRVSTGIVLKFGT